MNGRAGFSLALVGATLCGATLLASEAWGNTPPVVTEVWAEQRPEYGNKLYVHYKVGDADGDAVTVSLYLSEDGGATFRVRCEAVVGDVGAGITPGSSSRTIWWDARTDYPEHVGGQYVVRVVATETVLPPGEQRWFVPITNCGAAAVGYDNVIYVAAGNGNLYSLYRDGTVRWVVTLASPSGGAPTIAADGTIYLCAGAALRAIDPSGTVKWSYSGTASFPHSTPAIGSDGTIYVQEAVTENVHAVNPNGTQKWMADIGVWGNRSSIAIAGNGTVYAGSDDGGGLYSLSPSGSINWHLPSPRVRSSPAIGADGTIYISPTAYQLWAIAPDGSLRWTVNERWIADVYSSPTVGQNGTIYVGYYSELFAISPSGGVLWTHFLDGPTGSSPAIAADGTVYISDSAGALHAIDASGTERWKVEVGASDEGPTIDSSGLLLIGTVTGLHAFQADAPLASSPWPMFHHDVRHTGSAITP